MEGSTRRFLSEVFSSRSPFKTKHDYGRVLIAGGSERYPGAPSLAARAALRSGVGYVTALVQDPARDPFPDEVTRISKEAFYADLASRGALVDRYGCVVFGNGIDDSEENREALKSLLKCYKGTLLIDATGLTTLLQIGFSHLEGERECDVVLTPNFGEFQKLVKSSFFAWEADGVAEKASSFAQKENAVLFVKGPDVVCVSPDGETDLVRGRVASLSRAGTGDAFAGLLGGLLSYVGKDPLTVGRAAYEMLLESARNLEERGLKGMFSTGEIVKNLPYALALALEEKDDSI